MAAKPKPLKEGDSAPDFRMESDDGTVAKADFKGRNLVLYFYPRDNTPGCTKEACGFNEHLKAFAKADTGVVGVSRDSVKSHGNFRAKFDLAFALGADADGVVTENYGVWVEKQNYGRKYMGIERATFLIDKKGKIARIWRKVKVAGHVEEVLAAAKGL